MWLIFSKLIDWSGDIFSDIQILEMIHKKDREKVLYSIQSDHSITLYMVVDSYLNHESCL